MSKYGQKKTVPCISVGCVFIVSASETICAAWFFSYHLGKMALRPASLPPPRFLTNGDGIAQREQLWERSPPGWSQPSLSSVNQSSSIWWQRCKRINVYFFVFPVSSESRNSHPCYLNRATGVRRWSALPSSVRGNSLRTLVWGQFGYEKVTGAASVWKHIVLPARWPLWESTNRSKWFQMRVWTRARAHAPTRICWKQCQHWEDLADCVSPRALIHSRHGTVLVLDAVCCYKYMFSL